MWFPTNSQSVMSAPEIVDRTFIPISLRIKVLSTAPHSWLLSEWASFGCKSNSFDRSVVSGGGTFLYVLLLTMPKETSQQDPKLSAIKEKMSECENRWSSLIIQAGRWHERMLMEMLSVTFTGLYLLKSVWSSCLFTWRKTYRRRPSGIYLYK